MAMLPNIVRASAVSFTLLGVLLVAHFVEKISLSPLILLLGAVSEGRASASKVGSLFPEAADLRIVHFCLRVTSRCCRPAVAVGTSWI